MGDREMKGGTGRGQRNEGKEGGWGEMGYREMKGR